MPTKGLSKYLTSSVIVTFIITLTFILYVNVLFFDFINLDDNTYIYNNPELKNGLTWSSISWAWTTFGLPYYMPLTRLSYIVDAEIYNFNSTGFHFTNLIVHILNSILVFFISRSIFKSIWAGALIAIFFSAHPQHVEAVAWISQRKELLAALFGLASLNFYIQKYKISCNKINSLEKNKLFYLLSILLFLLSLLSKPTWVMFPFLLLLLDWCCFYDKKTGNVVNLLINKIPFLTITLFYSIIHLYSVSWKVGHVITSAQSLPFTQRLFNAPVIVLHYLTTGIYPFKMIGYQPYPILSLPMWQIFFSVIIFIVIFLIPISRKATKNLLFMGIAWFFISLLPVVGILGTGESVLIGDRWTYLPHIGLFIAIAYAIKKLIYAYSNYKRYILCALLIYICAHIYTAKKTISHWENSGAYWSWSIDTTTDNHYAYIKLGEYYESQGSLKEAEENYLKAHQINPSESLYVIYLGNIYAKESSDKAWHYYKKLLSTALAPVDIIFKMGITLMVNQQFLKAEAFFKKLIQITPDTDKNTSEYYLSHLYTGHLQLISGAQEDSIEYFSKALDLMPYSDIDNCKYAHLILNEVGNITNYKNPNQLNTLCKIE
jgi:protein O-mannosyl-transferase